MNGGTFPVRSPLDGSTLATLPAMGAGEVASAVAAARAAQVEWAEVPPGKRARRMRDLARVLARRGEEIADTVRRETGKPRVEAVAEVLVTAELIRYYAAAAPGRLAPRRVGTGWVASKAARVERDPLGVVGAITPWNYPFILPMDCVVPALFAGNAVVLKPSEITPLSSLLVPGLLEDAGVPGGLVQVVTGGGATGQALVEAGVDRVVFTGSTGTGRKVMESAARTLTPVTLELGGKDPAIVLEDADLERAARGVTFGGFFNAGQTCISVERVFVARPVFGPFVERVVELAAALRPGTGPGRDVGPMISPAQISVVERHVADAVARGARVLCGGGRDQGADGVFLPTVLVDVDDSMEVMREESFGPLLPMAEVADEDEAVARANASGYGLFASVWTGDRRRGLRVARRLRAGGVSVNDVLSHYGVASLPMGGVGESGFGRRRGLEALDDMTRSRALLVDRAGLRREPWWFPYGAPGERLMLATLEWRGLGGVAGVAAMARRLLARGE